MHLLMWIIRLNHSATSRRRCPRNYYAPITWSAWEIWTCKASEIATLRIKQALILIKNKTSCHNISTSKVIPLSPTRSRFHRWEIVKTYKEKSDNRKLLITPRDGAISFLLIRAGIIPWVKKDYSNLKAHTQISNSKHRLNLIVAVWITFSALSIHKHLVNH